ncbi:hypothetical protein RRG08_051424 [Elysia crispata]|uniref:Uncharacterized protein n=1 Tax=Elysia crispata TaxID=231223 RepID=A0AAE1B3G3_9GAST|nr:hypothetical protein RRG08_051424 [Elysia crispata]
MAEIPRRQCSAESACEPLMSKSTLTVVVLYKIYPRLKSLPGWNRLQGALCAERRFCCQSITSPQRLRPFLDLVDEAAGRCTTQSESLSAGINHMKSDGSLVLLPEIAVSSLVFSFTSTPAVIARLADGGGAHRMIHALVQS